MIGMSEASFPNPSGMHLMRRLGFSVHWSRIGIITPEKIAGFACELENGDNPHPEHYRWRAFSEFLATYSELPSSIARELYTLGDTDPDHALGGSIMAAIVRRPECPSDVLAAALQSSRKHLHKLVQNRRE